MKSSRDKAYNLVRAVLRAENDIKLAVLEAKTSQKRGASGGVGRAFVSDPTAQTAERHLTELPAVTVGRWRLRQPEAWLRVIALAYENAKGHEREIVKRYYAGEKIAEMESNGCGYTMRSIYVFIHNFENLAVEIACQYGLVKVIDT